MPTKSSGGLWYGIYPRLILNSTIAKCRSPYPAVIRRHNNVLLRENDVATSFSRNNDVVIVSCAR